MSTIFCIVMLAGCGLSAAQPAPAALQQGAVPPPPAVSEQAGEHGSSQWVQVEVESKALEKTMPVSIYLPPGYPEDAPYPVLYLLHGFGGSNQSWTSLHVQQTADRLIAAHKMRPLIIVMPYYGDSFGMNTSDGPARTSPSGLPTGRYEDFLTLDLVAYVDHTYLTETTRNGRYIGGASMGGLAALHLALRHPDLYGKVGGHSPSLAMEQFPDQEQLIYPTPKERAARDPLEIARRDSFPDLLVFLDCGDSDAVCVDSGAKLDQLLQEKGAHAEFHQYPGGHTMQYWDDHMADYLQFYGSQ